MRDAGSTRRTILLRAGASVLCATGLGFGIFFFYISAPIEHHYDHEWGRRHSQLARWEECEAGVRRFGWFHDTTVGQFGDMRWVTWIMRRIHRGTDLSTCSEGHKDSALREMTNQDVGKTGDAWLDWWSKNRDRSQEEWIREGFCHRGIDLETPLTKSNIVELLKIIGFRAPEEQSPNGFGVPWYLQYNAFRWLRDSDFDPASLSVRDLEREDGPMILAGLVSYSMRLGSLPKRDGVGVLPIGQPPPEPRPRPYSAAGTGRMIKYLLVYAPLAVGAWLFWRSLKPTERRRMVEPAHAPNPRQSSGR